MEDKGLVSVIMPSYKCGRFISESIKSVQAQIYQNWELIIVDDYSCDNTIEEVQQFQTDDKRISLFQELLLSMKEIKGFNIYDVVKERTSKTVDDYENGIIN